MTDTGQRIEEETADEASRVDSDPDSWSESEHDDSVLDEDYRPKKDDRPDDDSDADTAQHSEEEAALEAPAVKRHKRPRLHMWKRQVIKEKRLKGESYKNATGQERQPKTMGPPCTSQHCLRTIGSWLTVDMKTKTDRPKTKINKTGPHMPISDADQTFLKEWLSGLPTVPSHYCSQVPAYQDKKFVEPGTVLSDLHKEYQKAAGKSGARVAMKPVLPRVAHQYYDNLPHQ
ncbi:hypothetical protein JOQ06_006388 [Pogonophryne albipinna]|uniref:Uncharacterized protein n=1 Tax=Pogonophryne albipinna TaxID=1090488 RepID=A0AAD6BJ44_9TELE|nr:hypothetical protein JOQ06_006388 [Pogonophryne albipinna]